MTRDASPCDTAIANGHRLRHGARHNADGVRHSLLGVRHGLRHSVHGVRHDSHGVRHVEYLFSHSWLVMREFLPS